MLVLFFFFSLLELLSPAYHNTCFNVIALYSSHKIPVPFPDLECLVVMREKSVHSVASFLLDIGRFLSCPYLQLQPDEQGSLLSVGVCTE